MISPLILAIATQDVKEVKRLINRRTRVHESFNGIPAIALAVETGNVDIVRSLAGAGADVNVTYNSGKITPLNTACNKGDEAMVRLLLELGAEIDSSKALVGPIFSATKGKHIDIIRLLVVRGANVNHVTLSEQEHGIQVEGQQAITETSTHNTPLHHAAYRYDIGTYEALIGLGADDTLENSKGRTPRSIKEGIESLFRRR